MPVKIDFTTEEHIKKAPLPVHGSTYTVIPHATIIDHAKKELDAAGFSIERSLYRCSQNGNLASGVYHLNAGADPEMKMMFAWSNSYDKTMRFKCSAGSYVFVCMNGMMNGNIGNASRKHTGSALNDAVMFIEQQIRQTEEQYITLVNDKELLKDKLITKRKASEIIGRLFADEEILTLTQLGIVNKEMKNPSFNYNTDPDSAWSLYNHITHSLKESHPTSYLDDHSRVHNFFVNEFGLLTNKNSSPIVNIPVKEAQYELELESATNTVLFL